MKKLIGLSLLIGTSLTLQAAPLQYNLTGQINHMGGTFENFTGSMVISDPVTVVLGDGETDTRGDFQTSFTISDFNVASASHSLTQTGPSVITEFWEQTPPATFINEYNSYFYISTDKGFNFYSDPGDWAGIISWNGTPGEQPTSFHYLADYFGGIGNYRIENMTATVVPVPAAAWLLGSGLLGLIGVARRKRPS